jgi:serine/threonine-protein phosphatase 2A regulatory subunit B''
LWITEKELQEYDHGCLLPRVIQGVMQNCIYGSCCFQMENGTRLKGMEYRDFVRFILATEDKLHPTAIEYWFRVLDSDGDGVLSLYEIESFHDQQNDKIVKRSGEHWDYLDFICTM